ncbi:hypothetical protein [Rhodopila sp.]|uniref:hypothetical protein n=1 Tax=Rhodopila sp. TaxID=2480087 RepID=UPI003D09B77F
MANGSGPPAQQAVRALRRELPEADDAKIRRITAILDGVADPTVNQALLDPLRGRLASLKPARPLRFGRLLFIPIDPVVVLPARWKPEAPCVPRSVLGTLAKLVRDGLGQEALLIEKAISGHDTEAKQVITQVGQTLWPRAAAILAEAPCPAGWSSTGLTTEAYPPLAQAIAAVLRRAHRLHALSRDWDVGALEAEETAVEDIMGNIASESPLGCAIVVRLILLRSPQAVGLLRRFVCGNHSRTDTITLNQAMARGTDDALTHMESESGLSEEIGRDGLAGAVEQVRRTMALLRDIDEDPAAAAQRPRLRAIRQTLDKACKERLQGGIHEGLVTPLANATNLMDGADQRRLEICARDLRALETAARKLGSPASYDRLLADAADVVEKSDALTALRKVRLVEMLAGPDAAEALYRKTTAH